MCTLAIVRVCVVRVKFTPLDQMILYRRLYSWMYKLLFYFFGYSD